MNKEQQDLSWTCLPKEVREEIRRKYKIAENDIDLFIQTLILDDIFGIDNLTSDTEPSELLFVERKKILEYYKDVQQAIGEENGDTKIEMEGRKMAMRYFFGDKCLPNKENTLKSGELKSDKATCKENLQVEQPFVQVEPKFKYNINDKVILKGSDKPMLIRQRVGFKDYDNGYQITTLDTRYPQWVKESDLEPYTEPETKDNMEKNRCEKCKANAQQCADSPCQDYPLEEKELNLCELLKGCEGERFYLLSRGYATLKKIIYDEESCNYSIVLIGKGRIELYATGKEINNEAIVILYPSKELYEEYPLDAYSAWMEWKEARKSKRWRAEKGENYWWIDLACGTRLDNDIRDSCDDLCYENFNYFRTEDLAQQASEAVRECLEKFHESKNE